MKDLHFSRIFAMTPYKSLTLLLAEMSLCKDFIGCGTGDPYPLSKESLLPEETVAHGTYTLRAGRAVRFFTRFFPYASYALCANADAGEVGLLFRLPTTDARITLTKDAIRFCEGETERALPTPFPFTHLIVTARPGAFDLYFKTEGKTEFFATLSAPTFASSHKESVFRKGGVYLFAEGSCRVHSLSSYMDSGVSLADLRPIRYETGECMVEGGKIFLTASVRMQEGAYQGILSWIPGTCEFALVGALFFDSGDGILANDVAASILYDRKSARYLLWVCSFAHDHILGYADFTADPRFGINVIDISLMPRACEEDDRHSFLGFFGDEDPDLIYDEENDRWLFAVCRLFPNEGYRYLFFASHNPFSGFSYLGEGKTKDETGGSFVTLDGALAFVCGAGFDTPSLYPVYTKDGARHLSFDHPDGGFRGWGTVIPVKAGTRTREYLITFDRHGGSDYRWSYGTLYLFERSAL